MIENELMQARDRRLTAEIQLMHSRVRRLTAENELLHARVAQREGDELSMMGTAAVLPIVTDSVQDPTGPGDGAVGGLRSLERQHVGSRAVVQSLMPETERPRAQLMTSMDGSCGTSSSPPSPVVMLCGEAPDDAAASPTRTDVLPFVGDPTTRLGVPPSSASVNGGGAQMTSLEFLESRMGLADFVHDSAWREALVDEMRKTEQSYSEEESRLLAAAKDLLRNIDEGARPVKHAKTIDVAHMRRDMRNGRWWVKIKAVIPTSPRQVVAFLMQIESKFNDSPSNREFDVGSKVLEAKNLHHVVAFRQATNKPHRDRTFLNALVWRKISDAPLTYIWAEVPIEHHDKLPLASPSSALSTMARQSSFSRSSSVQAAVTRVALLTRNTAGSTIMEYGCCLDLMGRSSRIEMRNRAILTLMHRPYTLQVCVVGHVLVCHVCVVCKWTSYADVLPARQATSGVCGKGRRAPRPSAR
jgi:hypothetical protein